MHENFKKYAENILDLYQDKNNILNDFHEQLGNQYQRDWDVLTKDNWYNVLLPIFRESILNETTIIIMSFKHTKNKWKDVSLLKWKPFEDKYFITDNDSYIENYCGRAGPFYGFGSFETDKERFTYLGKIETGILTTESHEIRCIASEYIVQVAENLFDDLVQCGNNDRISIGINLTFLK